jgi:hypothetical protein
VKLGAFFPRPLSGGGLWPIFDKGIQYTQGDCPLPPSDRLPIVVKCELGTLPPGESTSVFILIGVDGITQPGKITSFAVVTSDQDTEGNQAMSTIEITKPNQLTPKEIEELGRRARVCGAMFGGPFAAVVNEIFDAYDGHKITAQEALERLGPVMLDLLGGKYRVAKVLSKFFGIDACVNIAEQAL